MADKTNFAGDELLSRASAIYAQLIFAGCVDNWEGIDLALRAGGSPASRLAALRYEFASRLWNPKVPEKLRQRILKFNETPA